MTWSISTSGTKPEVIERVRAATTDAAQQRQLDRMKVVIEQEVLRVPDTATSVTVSASGHCPGDEGGTRSTYISISADVPPKAKAPDPNDASVAATGSVS